MVVSLAPVPAHGQSQTAETSAWTSPRTPDGQPDLQGLWTNETITPFERPPQLAAKAFLTAEEASEFEEQAARVRAEDDRAREPGAVGSYNQFWFDSGTKVLSTRQTSLVVGPPDGRVPIRPEAEAKRDDNFAHSTDSYEYMSVWDRCISRGVPGSMFPAGYNNAYRILQVPGYVVVLYEMIHDARIIPLDGRPHVPGNIRLWMGDARGRWEGDTLVVETTNFHDRGWIASSAAAGRMKGIGTSEALHVVERFTRVDADTIHWEVTIEDPEVYTKPWRVAMPLSKNPDYHIFEYACHEGNYAVANILRGARGQEQASVEASKKE
jgi:hypothetical protein